MLRLSTRGRYATRIVAYIAAKGAGALARKREIAEAECISSDYVEQILIQLKTAKIVASRRGAGGGFYLKRDPMDITFFDVLQAVESCLSVVPCIEEECDRSDSCVTRKVWVKANDALHGIFMETRIGDVIGDKCHRQPVHA